MNKIAIVTDSTCDLSKDLLQKYNIKMLPLRVIFKDSEYRDRIEISPQEVYDSFDKEIPTTSLPLPSDVIDLFSKLKEENYTHVLILVISSGLSGTYNMVKNIADDFDGMEIKVLDSKSISMGSGLPVLQIAKELEDIDSFESLLDRGRKLISDSEVFYILKTLYYLRKGGRIGLVQGTLGTIFKIKPIISVNKDGEYYTYSKIRGRKKSISKIFKIVKEQTKGRLCNIAVMHANTEDEGLKLLEKIKKLSNVKEAYLGEVGPVVGVHTGPGLLGVCIQKL